MDRPLALATCAVLPAEADESALEAALDAAGVPWRWAVWNDPSVDWSAFAGVLIRTPWDYTLTPAAFVAWARAVGAQVPLLNPAGVVAWNHRKGYLLDLAARGVPVIPTVVAAQGDDPDGVGAELGRRGWDEVVVKPTIGVGSVGASRLGGDPAAVLDAVAALWAAGHDALVQPFVASIADEGETSTIVLDGRISHAVRKVPAAGDFRSQPEHGGQLEAVVADGAVAALAAAAWSAAEEVTGEPLTYARVDTVAVDGRPHLMELEVIEPDLFLGFADGAADRLVAAVLARLG